MKTRPAILVLCLGIGLALALTIRALPARGQTGILVTNADFSRSATLGSSGSLTAVIAAIQARILLDSTDANRIIPLPAINANLSQGLQQLAARILISVADRNASKILSYPRDLIGDHTAPMLGAPATLPDSGGVAVVWSTSEWATSAVDIGTQSGVYTILVADPLYAKTHRVIVPGLISGRTYVLRVRSVDRSGNIAQGSEISFVAVIRYTVNLPLVRK